MYFIKFGVTAEKLLIVERVYKGTLFSYAAWNSVEE